MPVYARRGVFTARQLPTAQPLRSYEAYNCAMSRLLIFLIVALVIDVFAIVDLVMIDRRRIRAFNKLVWVIIILAVPFVGALLWFIVGRGRVDKGGQQRSIAPDDDPAFLQNLRRDEEQDARIRRLEEELAELDDDTPKE